MSLCRRGEAALAKALAPHLRARASACLLLAVVAGLLLFRLGAEPVLRSAEERTRDVTRHMLETGEWLVPVRDGAPRLQKPPLYYWLAAAAASGDTLTTTALRAPAALSALALLAVVLAWGASLGGAAAAAAAAIALLGMGEYWALGRRGVAEMPLALFTTAALFAFDRAYWGRRRAAIPSFCALVLGGFLAKATVALLVIGLPIALQLALDRSLGRVWRRDLACGLAVAAVAALAWYAAILARVPGAGAALREAALLPLGVVESTGAARHARPCWFFVPALFASALPAVLAAPLALLRVEGRPALLRDARARFVGLAFASLFVAFSSFPMKQKHYLMPLLPLLALALGTALPPALAGRRRVVAAGMRRSAWVFALGGPLFAAAASAHLVLAERSVAWASGAALALLGISALGFAAARSAHGRVLVAALLGLQLVGVAVVESSFGVWRARFEAAAKTRRPVADAPRLEAALARHRLLRAIYGASEAPPAPSKVAR